MRGSRFSQVQIVAILKQADTGMKGVEFCRESDISGATYSNWKSRCAASGYTRITRSDNAKTGLGGLIPSHYAQKLAARSDTVTVRL